MFAKKRTGGAAASDKNKQAKHTGPAAARASKSVDVQDGKSRFIQKAPLLCSADPLKSEVNHTVRATKVAWLLESNRANESGEDISDEQLKQLYLSGRKSFLRHAANPEVRAKNRTGCRPAPRPRTHSS